MGSIEPPRRGQIAGFRVALATALVLNSIALWLVATRPILPVAVGPASTPTAVAANLSPGPADLTPGPSPTGGAETTATATPGGTAVAAGPTETALPQVLHPGGKVRGFNVPVWGPDFAVARPSIANAAGMDANWVALVTHWYVSSAVPYTGGGIFREEGNIDNGKRRTSSDASVGAAIDLAHAAGLKVLLKPHVDWADGGWRGWIYFKDDAARTDWWTSYKAMIQETVRLAMEHHADGICIGTELFSINNEAASAAAWTDIIATIRAAGYTGQLTYAANWGYGDDTEYNRPGLAGVWEQLDYVGIDAYFPISEEQDPSLETLIAGWTNGQNAGHQDHVAALEALAKRTGKSVVFTEVGYPDKDFAAKEPSNDSPGPRNDALQARAADALYKVWADLPWWGGAFWWQAGPLRNTHSIQGRPIADVLSADWATQTAGP